MVFQQSLMLKFKKWKKFDESSFICFNPNPKINQNHEVNDS